MKITLMRLIDYWLGRPLCLLLSIWPTVKERLLGGSAKEEKPDKVLFIKLFGIGSIILSYPAVSAFKKSFPDTKIYYLTFRANKEILEILGLVDPERIITIRDDSILHIVTDALKAISRVKKEGIRLSIDLEFFSRFTAVFAYLAGAVRRVGFFNYHTEGLSRGMLINVPVSYNHTKHTSEVFTHLVTAVGAAPPEEPRRLPNIKIDDYTLPPEITSFKKKIVLNLNSSELISLRTWHSENFTKLADIILDKYKDAAVIFVGTTKERSTVERAVNSITHPEKSTRVFDLSGSTTLKELIGLYSNSDALVTIDSGSPHIASLTDITIIDLFGPETPALYGPLSQNATNIYLDLPCQPCVSVYNGKLSHCTDNICMQQISPDQIFKLLESQLR